MDTIFDLLVDISKDLVCGAVNQLHYSFCFNGFVKELEQEEVNFTETKRSVEDRVTHARKQTLKTAEVMDKWLENANIDAEEVNRLLKEVKSKKNCCFGYCPNWIWRYRLGKKLANKKMDLQKIIEEGRQYIQLERTASIPSNTLDILTEKCMNFESRKITSDQLMEALKDDGIAMIGLYGMGGCGKTTLAMEIKKMAEDEHLFDKVIFVPVSSIVEVPRIQEKIASSLEYKFPENEEMERAQRLCMRLIQEKNILMILDDVWEKLDFGRIGIPSSEHHKGCKILITTRSEEVCTSMDCQRKIYLPILTHEEAWTLFQKKAVISEITPETIKHLAKTISDECKGLPVAIAAVASSLKGKKDVIWSVALNRLRSSKPINIGKGLQDPYKCLQLSYDNLDSEEAKSLFLLCSVFPEDYEIPVECLIRCAIGLGMVGEVKSYEDARREVMAAKIKLVSSCLILDADYESVKMHDLVRDVAQWIAKNENNIIKCETEKDVALEQSPIRYLWCVKFPDDMDCSNLEFLCIRAKLEVSDEIFERMRKLRVLIVTSIENYSKLLLSTRSFKTLTNLRCIILQYWELSDISFVRDMKKLQSLSLHGCSWPPFIDMQIDLAFTQLKNLKLIEFNGCDIEIKNLEEIKRIPLLEELYIIQTGSKYNDRKFMECFNLFSFVQTLQSMNELNQLKIIDCEEIEYLVDTGNALSKISSSDSLHLLESAEYLSEQPQGLNLLIMRNIREINLNDFDEPKYLFSLSVASIFKLESLSIENCRGLQHIIDIGDDMRIVEEDLEDQKLSNPLSPQPCFPKLTTLIVEQCHKLKYLTSVSAPNDFPNLDFLVINGATELLQFNETGKSQVELSELKGLIFIHLSKFCQETQFLNVKHRIVHNCPKLSLTSTTTLEEIQQNFDDLGFKDSSIDRWEFSWLIDRIKESDGVSTDNNELPSSQNLVQAFEDEAGVRKRKIKTEADKRHHVAELWEYDEVIELKIIDCEEIEYLVDTGNALSKVGNLFSKLKQIIGDVVDEKEERDEIIEESNHFKTTSIPSPTTVNRNAESFVGDMVKMNDTRNKETSNSKDNTCHQLQKSTQIELPALQNLTLDFIPKYIIPYSYYVRCPSLETLSLGVGRYVGFSTVNSSSNTSEMRQSDYIKIKISSLDSCHLLESAEYLSEQPQGLNLLIMRNIREINLNDFDESKYLFNLSVASLFKLQILRIENCSGLQHIIDIGDECESKNWDAIFPNLKHLSVKNCEQLEYMIGPYPLDIKNDKEIHLHFPTLEELKLDDLPNLISICATNSLSMAWPSLKISRLVNISTSRKDAIRVQNHFLTLETLRMDNAKVEAIFCLNENQMMGQKVNLKLKDLDLKNLPQTTNIWEATKNTFTLQHLKSLQILRCEKLEVIFPPCVLRCLPELNRLEVRECKELRQIIEEDLEDQKLSNPLSPQPCFPKLTTLIVEQCHKLKYFTSVSASNDFPNLDFLLINGATELLQFNETGKTQVELPELKLLIFIDLSKFCQETQFLHVKHRIVRNCPKLFDINYYSSGDPTKY
ncbi:hypothetical protein VNO80_05224 [Phaseolus coccineus]|uniref:NB-ARC domain-containing protein n=1 Tax=Phaseolus coccineus TaxID=3886 RepID=A0AAN9NLJ1_PHACN